ncbi:hypothetical protein GF358_01395 [Candidatus Woesearchaeota archaeon]|nr:hypothetical protein [Candidatus Woesearchaeota archaeon]
MSVLKVEKKYADSIVNLALDTLKSNKQALVFVNTKKSAEKCAEEIAKKLKQTSKELNELSSTALKAVQKPTKQCRRLSVCLEKGIAFHHASLHSKQKELIESNFRQGNIKIICCTPTLAAGLDLPAFRAIIRDTKRYTGRGMTDIPVLEYLQMSGRAGRPNYDTFGEAILVSSSDGQKDALTEKYVQGEPEDIYSKLAVEPVLRTYLLSLIATKVIQTKEQILSFFEKTFWAFQFKDLKKLEQTIVRMLKLLESWEFIQYTDSKFRATVLGRRIAELYIDPFTAHEFVVALEKTGSKVNALSLLQLISNTLEMRPLLRVKLREYDDFQEEIAKYDESFITNEPSMFDPEYDVYLNSIKTSFMLNEWIEEKDDDYLMENYDVGPGIVRMKIETANWLLYALYEIARIQQKQEILKDIIKLKFRLRYGVKEELLSLLKLKNIGRVRARKLFKANLKKLSDLRKAKPEFLTQVLGSKKVAENILEQVGIKNETNNNKGQLNNFS